VTVIAWDGRTLAADKMCADDWTARRVTKIRRLRGGEVIAGASGAADRCRALMAWLDAGGEFPAHLRTADQTHATVLAIFRDGRRVALYQREPEPIWLDNDTPHAIGSGAEAALAAMHCGRTSREAVQVASLVCRGVGMGVDTLEFDS